MRVDFYQLGSTPLDRVIANIAERLIAKSERLLVVATDEALLTRLDRMLWDQGSLSFVPHGVAGGIDDARQPVLLSSSEVAPNLARNLLIADGLWRDSALSFERTFYLFGADAVEPARLAWKSLAGRDGADRAYWAQEGGKWVEKG